MGIVDGWMDEEDGRFFFFLSLFVDGLVGGSILALICFCSLGTYMCFFSFGFWERIVVPC